MNNILFSNGFSKGFIGGRKEVFFVEVGEGGKKFRIEHNLF